MSPFHVQAAAVAISLIVLHLAASNSSLQVNTALRLIFHFVPGWFTH